MSAHWNCLQKRPAFFAKEKQTGHFGQLKDMLHLRNVRNHFRICIIGLRRFVYQVSFAGAETSGVVSEATSDFFQTWAKVSAPYRPHQ